MPAMKTCIKYIYLRWVNEISSTSDCTVSNDHKICEWLIEMDADGRGIIPAFAWKLEKH